ncbi:MAG: DMT family protein [Desulfobacterales bacterium]|nr:DMT family protein [Desulfobacterales bacterium]
MKPYFLTVVLLCFSNVFMTLAWYGHLKNMSHKHWIFAALVSWGIALFEYIIQVPANRIGHHVMNVGQLKILQEVITLTIFMPFSMFYLKERINLDYLWASLCILAAVFFVFRKKLFGA